MSKSKPTTRVKRAPADVLRAEVERKEKMAKKRKKKGKGCY